MDYKFYRNNEIRVKPINKDYAWIKDQYHLYDLLDKNGWTIETCAPRLRENWNQKNKTCGQCSITSFLIQDIFGGEVYGVQSTSGVHCFNKIGDVIFDITSEQFKGDRVIKEYPLDKLQSREEHFSNEEKFNRYKLLKEHINKCK
ncbi:MAG: hypothetical protein HUJ59_00030 [Bacilli bacterium]|nr:hypothetical protein [Bacilli bacterium]